MIHEKELFAQLKREWKGLGYEVYPTSQGFLLTGIGWAVEIPAGLMPRKVLGMLVEHIGEIPESAWKVNKAGPQSISVGMAVDVRSAMEEAEVQSVAVTTILYKGRELWQREDGKVFAFHGELTAMAEGEWLCGERGMLLSDEGGRVYIHKCDTKDDPVLEALEKVQLV